MYATPPLGRAGQCGFRGRGVTPVTFDVRLCGHILEFNIFVWQKNALVSGGMSVGVVRKLYMRQEDTSSSPAGCKIIFLHCTCCLVPGVGTGTKDPCLWSRTRSPGSKIGTKECLEPE